VIFPELPIQNTQSKISDQTEGYRFMGVNKEHKEFHAVDMSTGWETPAGYPAGIFPYCILVDRHGNVAGHGSLRDTELQNMLREMRKAVAEK